MITIKLNHSSGILFEITAFNKNVEDKGLGYARSVSGLKYKIENLHISYLSVEAICKAFRAQGGNFEPIIGVGSKVVPHERTFKYSYAHEAAQDDITLQFPEFSLFIKKGKFTYDDHLKVIEDYKEKMKKHYKIR